MATHALQDDSKVVIHKLWVVTLLDVIFIFQWPPRSPRIR